MTQCTIRMNRALISEVEVERCVGGSHTHMDAYTLGFSELFAHTAGLHSAQPLTSSHV